MSTSRFMLLWALSAAPIYLAWGWWSLSDVEGAVPYLAGVGVAALSLGLVQFALLARYRARVRYWTPAFLLGWLVSSSLTYQVDTVLWSFLRFPQDLRVFECISATIWGGTQGLCVGVALGLALWGRRWSSAWPLWISGLMIVEIGSALLMQVFFRGQLVAWPIEGALVMAGMAWLLDRLVFKHVHGFRRSNSPEPDGRSSRA